MDERELDTKTFLGFDAKTGDLVALDNVDRYAGTYVLGVQGAGKSGLLQFIGQQDVLTGRALIVLDPHGDLITDFIARLPYGQLPNAYLLDLTDEVYPFGLNLFAHGVLRTEAEKSNAIERVMHVFEVLWPEVEAQQHLPMYLRMALQVLFVTPGTTLPDLLTFLMDEDYRGRLLNHPDVPPDVRNWWLTEYDALKPDGRKQRVQALLNRLYALFMGKALVRNIVGQQRSTINWRQAIEQRKIIFVKLPIKTLRQEAELVGTMVLSEICQAVYSFADLPKDQRPGVTLIIDEFQHFATHDIEELFTEGRKFGMRLIIAHQYRAKLPGYLQSATLTARTKIVFRPTSEDALGLARLFPNLEATVDPDPHPCKYLVEHYEDFPEDVQEFIRVYLRKMGKGKVTIEHPHTPLWAFVWTGPQRKPLKLESPIPALDSLLRDVMRTQDPNVPIPGEIAIGFSNCGVGFHSVTQTGWKRHDLINPHPYYPPHLVIDGHSWLGRRPEDEREQLYHFIFHLRVIMRYLAAHPVGESKSLSAIEVARRLIALPNREAYVSTSGGTHHIGTLDTMEPVGSDELFYRERRIQMQSREKYAHPRKEVVNSAVLDTPPEPVAAPPASPLQTKRPRRFEEV